MPERSVIAVVDDDVSVREAVVGLLHSHGFAAEGFASGREYLQSGRLRKTSCLILDVQMADMSGPELQAQLVQWGCRVPTILITAFPEDRPPASAMKTGAVGILIKPFDDDELLACIQLALERKNGSKLD